LSWAIETEGLTKQYPRPAGWGDLLPSGRGARPAPPPPAVEGLSLHVAEGELFGLLGPNGAGKTTLVKLLCTLVAPTSGWARVAGCELHEEERLKARVGLASGDERSFYGRLSARQNLEFFAHLHRLPEGEIRPRVEAVLEAVGLAQVAGQPFQTFSTGMRQRLSIARALLHQPRLLFLDEPTRGLDPLAARRIQRLVREELVERRGLTIFLTTHDLAEAAQLCDRLAIMHRGRLLACGTLEELLASQDGEPRFTLRLAGLDAARLEALAGELGASAWNWGPGEAQATLALRAGAGEPAEAALERAMARAGAAGATLVEARRERPSLEEVFERLVEDAGEGAPPTLPAAAAPTGNTPAPAGCPAEPRPAAGAEAEPGPGGLRAALRTAAAFFQRDLRSEASYRVAFILQFLNIFFQVGVFYFISRLLGPAAAPYLEPYRGDYFAFVLIGIAFAGYFGVGLSSFSGSLRQAQTTGTLEAMLATPTRLPQIVLGSALWDYALTTLKVLVYLAFGALAFGVNFGGGNFPAALLILALTLAAFSSLGIIAASFIMVLKRGDPVTWAFSALSGLMGGVYYPLSVLPEPLQWVGRLLPVTYALEGMRLALLNGAPFRELLPQVLALAAFTAVLLPLSLWAFRRAVRRARIDGSLTHY